MPGPAVPTSTKQAVSDVSYEAQEQEGGPSV